MGNFRSAVLNIYVVQFMCGQIQQNIMGIWCEFGRVFLLTYCTFQFMCGQIQQNILGIFGRVFLLICCTFHVFLLTYCTFQFMCGQIQQNIQGIFGRVVLLTYCTFHVFITCSKNYRPHGALILGFSLQHFCLFVCLFLLLFFLLQCYKAIRELCTTDTRIPVLNGEF